jgi:hypothetical protein
MGRDEGRSAPKSKSPICLLGYRQIPEGAALWGVPRIHIAHKEDVAMSTYDTNLLWRSTIGFDRLFDHAVQ